MKLLISVALCVITVGIWVASRLVVFNVLFYDPISIHFPLTLSDKLYPCVSDAVLRFDTDGSDDKLIRNLLANVSKKYPEKYLRMVAIKPSLFKNALLSEYQFMTYGDWQKQIGALSSIVYGPVYTNHYTVTLVTAEGTSSFKTAASLLGELLTTEHATVSSSMNILSNFQFSIDFDDTALRSDIIDALTRNSQSLWNQDFCMNDQSFQSCTNLIFVVSHKNITIVNNEQSVNDVLLKLEGSNSWGSFVTCNSDNFDHCSSLIQSHLEQMLPAPRLIWSGGAYADESGHIECSEQCHVHDNLNDVVVRLDSTSLSDVLRQSVLQWSILRNTLADINRRVEVIHSLFIGRNALLWYDAMVNANWVVEYKRMVQLLTTIKEKFLLFDTMDESSVAPPVVDWQESVDSTLYLLEKELSGIKRTCSTNLLFDEVKASILEVNRIIVDLHDDPLSRYLPAQSSRLALEEYFAIFAPFWLPIFVPVVKSVKLLL